jgi:hypothetical protein
MKKILLIFFCSIFFFKNFSQNLNYYFGNLHSHTGFSDGNKDSSSSGMWSPANAYAYAKASLHFDFLGVSEHNHYSSIRSPGFRKQNYAVGISQANASNVNGTFAALFGMEYGVSSNYNGHVIIYGFNQLIGWETGISGVAGGINYDIYNAKSDYDGLFTKVKNNSSAFAYLAHPGFSDFTTNQTANTSLAYGTYNAGYDSAIVGTPLRSGLAFSTAQDYLDYSQGNYFDYYKKMLYQGYHLGIGYDHDNHYSNFGRSNGGRLVVITNSLSPTNIISAMQQMHFYGSDDWNAKVDFKINGNLMGSILYSGNYPSINVIHNDADGEMADTIKIWRGYKNSGGLWAEVIKTSLFNNTLSFVDSALVSGNEYYYFAEIKQSDKDWIVTSPIWYNAQAPLKVEDSKNKFDFIFYPNPVKQNLSLSTSKLDNYNLKIVDLTGRIIFERHFYSDNEIVKLHNFEPGIYLLEIKNSNSKIQKKLIVE